MKFNTHVCLVSAQATPNLTPLLDATLKPRRVVLVTSPDMTSHSDALATVIKRKEIVVERLVISDAYDYAGVEDALLNWLAANESSEVALNITGGTKVMAMAAQSVFMSANKPIFYVKIETDEVMFLDHREYHPLDARVKLRDYLEAHRYELTESPAHPQIRADQRDLVNRLVDHVESAGAALGQINGLALSAIGTLRSPLLDDGQHASHKLRDVISLFAEGGVLTESNGRIIFPNESARAFTNGGWLELYVSRVLSDIAPTANITEHAMNLDIVAPDGRTRNEIDAAFMHRNRLHIIETKTSNLSTAGSTGDNKATEAIYKLETLLKLGGLRTRGMLVDYRGKLTVADRARAEQSHIRIVSGVQLKNLSNEIRNWINESH